MSHIRYILAQLCLAGIISQLFFPALYAEDTQEDFNATKTQINAIQTANPVLPNSVSQQRGRVGEILRRLFDNQGRIGNWYIKALRDVENNAVMRWSGGKGGFFATGSIYDTGTRVGIGESSPGFSLDISGDINFTGDLRKNGVIFNPTGKWDDGTNPLDAVYMDGDVGIGTLIPSESLSVVGRISVTGDPNSDDDIGDRAYNDARYINTTEKAADADLLDGLDSTAFVRTTTNQTIGGTKTFSSTIAGSINGNSATATALETARTIGFTGVISGSSSFDGTSNISIATTLADDSVTSAKIADGTIVNADVNNSAAIAGTKISPNFGAQNISTTGNLTVDTNTLFVNSTLNRVGIGTVSPGFELDVNGRIRLNRTAPYVIFNETDTGKQWWQVADGQNMTFREDGTGNVRFTIQTGGNIIAHNKFTAYGDIQANGTFIGDGSTITNIAGDNIQNGTIDSTEIQDNSLTATDIAADAIGASELANDSVASANIINGSIVNADVNASAAIAGTKISPNFGSQDVTTTGKVGIGITNPTQLLQVHNNSSGAVSLARFTTVNTGDANSDGVAVGYDSEFDLAVLYNRENSPLVLGTNNNPQMWITGTGDVGIGTTSPSEKLDVSGNVNITGTLAVGAGINGDDITDGTIDSTEIENGSITSADIADNTIAAIDIAADAIGASELANDSVASANIINGSIVNADVNASAAIAGTKISPNFGSQNITTTGDITFRELNFANQEAADLTTDGEVGFDASRGMIIYRTQQVGQETGNGTYTVLDTSNINGGSGINIANTAGGISGTQAITFSVDDGPGSGLDADTLDGIDSTSFVQTTGNQTIGGIKTFTGTIVGDISGNAGTSTVLATARNIAMSGDITGSASFNGGANISIASTIANGVVNSAKISDNTIAAIDIAADAVGASELANNSVASANIINGSIVNADVNASAAIAGTKISPNFGAQNISTTGNLTVDTNTLFVNSTLNRVGIGTVSPGFELDVNGRIRLNRTAPYVIFNETDTGKQWWQVVDGQNMSFREDGTAVRFTIQTGGNIIAHNKFTAYGDIQANGTFIGDGSTITNIAGDNIQNGTIDSTEIQNGTIAAIDLATNAVTSAKILDGEVTSADINNNTITETDISDAFVARDSNLLDALDSTAFIRSNAADDVTAHTEWQDNQEVRLGSSADMRLFHNGSNSYIRNYTGVLQLRNLSHGNGIQFQAEDAGGTNRNMILADPDDNVRLFYAGLEKLETTTNGINVTGTVTASDPTAASHLATKNYVDTLVTAGVTWKAPVESGNTIVGTWGACDAGKQSWTTYNKNDDIIYICDGSTWLSIGSSASIPYATTTTAGKIQIAGDIEGTWNNITLKNGVVDSAAIANGSITSADIAANTITAGNIGAAAVGASEITDGSVRTQEIANGTIVNADISASAAIAGTKISPNFGSQNITTTGNANINEIQFANLEPTNLSADGNIGFDSSRGLIIYRTQEPGQESGDGAYTVLDTANITGGSGINISNTAAGTAGLEAITFSVDDGPGSGLDADTLDGIDSTGFIQVGTSGDQIQNGTIDGSEIQDNTLAAADIAADAIGASELANDSVASANVINNSLTAADLAANSVNSSEITNGAIVNADINNSAAIAGSKISPNFGTQTITGGIGVFNPGGNYPYIQIGNQSNDKIYADNNPTDPYGGGMWFRVANNDNSAWYDVMRLKENGRVQITYDPTIGDDVGNRDYNDARYINVGEAINGDNITNGTIDSSEIQDNTLTAADLAANSVSASEITDGQVRTQEIANNTITETDISDAFVARSAAKVNSKGNLAAETLRSVHDTGIYTFNTRASSLGGSSPSSYWSTLAWGQGAGGSTELASNWVSGGNELWFRSLRDTTDNWYAWKEIWHSGNFDITNINGDNITNGTVDSSEIQDNTLTAADLAANSVNASEITDGQVRTQEIANNTITETDISDAFVARNSQLLDGYNSAEASTASTVAVRNASGDINARLFRSEYDSTNSTIGFIMTQVDTVSNNYIRPSTPAQFRAAVTDGSYINIGSSGDQLQNGTVDSSEIQDNTLTAADLAANSVGNSELNNGAAFTMNRLNLSSAADAALASTTHGLTVGPTNSTNIILDGNEIMARNNGANSTLYIQNDGGTTSFGGVISGNGTSITNINGDNITNGTVDSSEIQDNTLTASDLAANSVANSELNNTQAFTMAGLTTNGVTTMNMNGSYDIWLQGAGTTGTAPRNLALLGNKAQDRLYLNYSGEFSGGTYIGGNGENELGIGDGLVSGSYGSIQTYGSGKGGWEGYSINGRAVFMHDGANTTGIYNDVDNEWILHATHNAGVSLRYNGNSRVITHASGLQLQNQTQIDNVTCIGNCF